MKLPGGMTFSCQEACSIPRHVQSPTFKYSPIYYIQRRKPRGSFLRHEAVPSDMPPLQTILRSTSFPRVWWTMLGSFVRVSSQLSLTVYLNLSSCEQRSTFLLSAVFHAGNLSDWHCSSVHRGYFCRKARDISIYQGDDCHSVFFYETHACSVSF